MLPKQFADVHAFYFAFNIRNMQRFYFKVNPEGIVCFRNISIFVKTRESINKWWWDSTPKECSNPVDEIYIKFLLNIFFQVQRKW